MCRKSDACGEQHPICLERMKEAKSYYVWTCSGEEYMSKIVTRKEKNENAPADSVVIRE
jgi:hypothetical protein